MTSRKRWAHALGVPKSVKVGPYQFMIKWVNKTPTDGLGETSFLDLTIYLRERMAAQQMKTTLLHELMHCIAYVVDDRIEDDHRTIKLTEEDWVCRTSPMLLAVLQDNPEVHEFLFRK